VRQLKKLSLVAIAALALSGLWAASAFAQKTQFQAASYPQKVTGTQEGGSTLTASGVGPITCNTSLAGEITGPTQVLSLSISGKCNAYGVPFGISANGCKVELNPTWQAVGFGPSGCGPITIPIFGCTITIPSQNGLYATYQNGTVSVQTATLRSSCGGGAQSESGSFNVTWKLSGATTATLPESGIFGAERYPTNLVGNQEEGAPFKIRTVGGNIECKTAAFSGSLTAASGTMTLTPTYSGCSMFGFPESTVATNGCSYKYYVEGSNKDYPMDINCPAGASIVVTGGNCSLSIPPQSGLKTVNYQLIEPSPTDRAKIRVIHTVSGLTYTVTKSGFACPLGGLGTYKTGTVSGNTIVEGTNSEGRPANIRIGV